MRALNIIKFLGGTWWGSDPSTLIILYKSFVRSLIDYGCYIYFPSSVNLIKKLKRIQYIAIRSALGLRIITPSNIVLAEAELLSIKDRTELLRYSYPAKVMSNLNSTTFKCITSFQYIDKKRTLIRNSLISRCISNFINSSHNIDLTDNEHPGAAKKFEDKEFQALLDEDPTQSQQQLAQTLNVTPGAIFQRLKAMGKIQTYGKWVPHQLNDR